MTLPFIYDGSKGLLPAGIALTSMINFAAYNAGALASAMAVMMILAWGGGRLIGRRLRDDLSPPAQPVHEFVSGKLSPYITLFGLAGVYLLDFVEQA